MVVLIVVTGMGARTAGVGQFILFLLDTILQAFCFSSGSGDLGLHRLARHIGRHGGGRNAVAHRLGLDWPWWACQSVEQHGLVVGSGRIVTRID